MTESSAATIACPDAVLICGSCEQKVHRLTVYRDTETCSVHQATASVCDACLEALTDA